VRIKKGVFYSILILLVFSLTGCFALSGLFPNVEPPARSDTSMLVVEVGQVEAGGESSMIFNSNATGWAPWVEDSNGNLVKFRNFDAESRLDTLYYASNLIAGEYTLKGFLHVYIDYSRLKDGEIALYGPFENYHYHVVQKIPIANEVKLNLQSADIATFGRYYVNYNWVGGLAGTTDDRWKVNLSTVKITGDFKDKKALRVMKNWATPNWKLWNERNKEIASDN
jgi:hypothetical protein